MTRALQLMADRGWIAITPQAGGKRVTLTAAGKDLLAVAADDWRAATNHVAERLNRDGLLPVLLPESATPTNHEESP